MKKKELEIMRLSQVNIDQRMTLFKLAHQSSRDAGPDVVLDTFSKYLRGLVEGLPVSYDAITAPDLFEEFLAARCDFDETARTQSQHLYNAYVAWLQAATEGVEPPSPVKFGRMAAQRLTKKYSNVVYYLGIVLRKEETEAEELAK